MEDRMTVVAMFLNGSVVALENCWNNGGSVAWQSGFHVKTSLQNISWNNVALQRYLSWCTHI